MVLETRSARYNTRTITRKPRNGRIAFQTTLDNMSITIKANLAQSSQSGALPMSSCQRMSGNDEINKTIPAVTRTIESLPRIWLFNTLLLVKVSASPGIIAELGAVYQ